MEIEKQSLWIISGDGVQSIEDGETFFYKNKIGDKDHKENCRNVCEKLGLELPISESHDAYGEHFNRAGIAVVFNSAVTIDGKYFASMYLPEQLTARQIEFFENQRTLFYEKYNPLLTESIFYTTKNKEYVSSKKNYRDLKIEKLINGVRATNNIDLFYEEIDRQKEELYTK